MKSLKKVLNLVLAVCLSLSAFPLVATSVQAAENYNAGTGTTLYAVKDAVCYGYQTLTETQKDVYELVCTVLEEDVVEQKAVIPEGWQVSAADLELVMEMIHADHPEYFWFNGAYSYSKDSGTGCVVGVTPRFRLDGCSMTDSKLSSSKATFQSKLNDVLSAMSRAGLTTDYDKALWLHDKVAELVTYVYSANDQSAYGALVDGKAVCAGYARLYQVLLQSAGIRAWTVCGDSVDPVSGQLIPHAWNLMWLGDTENCLYADVTWDDQKTQLYHLFFARTLNEMKGDHAADAVNFSPRLPTCTSACANQYAYGTENIISGAVTADAMAERMTSTDGGQTYAGIFYDPDQKIETWIHTDGNFGLLLESMGLLGRGGSFSLSSVKLDGTTAGAELHLTLTVTGISPQPPVQANVKVTAQGSIAYTVSGQTVTVTHTAACRVGYLSDGKYVAIVPAANADGSYSFTVPAGVTEVLLVVRGDVNGDGKITSSDYGRLNASLLGKVTLTPETSFAADVNGDGKANSSDYGRLNAVMLGKTALAW